MATSPGTFQYDPNKVSCIVGTKVLKGFTDGSFIKAERYADAYKLSVGVGSEATRTRINNKSGHIDFTLQSSSASNDDLSAVLALDELSDTGFLPLLVRDASGRTVVKATIGWGKKFPAAEFKNGDISDWTWVFDTGILEIDNIGGNLQIG